MAIDCPVNGKVTIRELVEEIDTKEDALGVGNPGQLLATNSAADGKEWVDGGDMTKSVYDTDNSGVVDNAENAEKLGGQLPTYYEPSLGLGSAGQVLATNSTADGKEWIDVSGGDWWTTTMPNTGYVTGYMPDGTTSVRIIGVGNDGVVRVGNVDSKVEPVILNGSISVNGTLSVPNASANDEAMAFGQFVGGLGMTGENWVDMLSSRSLDTNYTNNEDYPIMVSIRTLDAGPTQQAILYINDQTIVRDAPNGEGKCDVQGIIPPGSTYRIQITTDGGYGALSSWWELR